MTGHRFLKILDLLPRVLLHALASFSFFSGEGIFRLARDVGHLGVGDDDAVGVFHAIVAVPALPLVRLFVVHELASLPLLDALLLCELFPLGHRLLLGRQRLGAREVRGTRG